MIEPVDTIVLVDPSTRPTESWYCVATSQEMGPWWTVLLTKAGQYQWTNVAGVDRERMLAKVRQVGVPDVDWLRGTKGWMAVAAHPDHAVKLPGLPRTTTTTPELVPMTPKRIPFCGTEQEVLDRVRLTAARDKEFAAKWRGWRFLAIRHDDGVML